MATMLPDGRRIGAHLAVADGLVKAGERAVEIGASALQIFSDNPTAWERRAAAAPDIPAFRKILADADIAPLAIHGAYLINLAGDDPGFHDRSVRLLAAELETARWLRAGIINIHVGSHRGAGIEAGVEAIVRGILAALAAESRSNGSGGDSGAVDGDGLDGGAVDGDGLDGAAGVRDERAAVTPTIALENSAGGGGGLGVDIDELAAIARALDAARVPRERVGFCLDLAHLWGAGVDISDRSGVDRWIRTFTDEIGIDRLPLIHLNDTKAELGSRTDRHEHVGAGRIGVEGIAAVLRHPALASTAYILETPGMDEGYDAINLRRAEAIAAGRPLEPLPEGALTLGGSRTRAAYRRAMRAEETASADAAAATADRPA
jgi:deoxyribonuclease-4